MIEQLRAQIQALRSELAALKQQVARFLDPSERRRLKLGLVDVDEFGGDLAKASRNAVGKTLYLAPETTAWLTGDLTVTAPVLSHGGKVRTNGHALTIGSFPNPGPIQVFDISGGGSVKFSPGAVEELDPRWWGLTVLDPTDPEPSADAMTLNVSAMEACINAAIALRGLVRLPSGAIWYNDRLIDITGSALGETGAITVEGRGEGQTWLRPASTYTGFCGRAYDLWRNAGEDVASPDTIDHSRTKARTRIGRFTIAGDRTTEASGWETYGRTDYLYLYDIGFSSLNGTAILLAGDGATGSGARAMVREAWFDRMNISNCGNATSPCWHITTNGEATDQTNNLWLDRPRIGFPYGEALLIESESRLVRRIDIFAPMLHGAGNKSFAPAADVVRVKGNVQGLNVWGARLNGSTNISLTGTVAATNGLDAIVGTGTAFTTELAVGQMIAIQPLTTLTGTVTVELDSVAVVGSGTLFTSELSAGDRFEIDGVPYRVGTITDDTHMDLATAYEEADASGLSIAERGALTTYRVATITDDTNLTLLTNYTASTASGLAISAPYAALRLQANTAGTQRPTGCAFIETDVRGCKGHGIVVEGANACKISGYVQAVSVGTPVGNSEEGLDGNEVRFESTMSGTVRYDMEGTGTRSIYIHPNVVGQVRAGPSEVALVAAGATPRGSAAPVDGWYRENVAASLALTPLTRLATTTAQPEAIPIDVASYLMSVWVWASAAVTAGSISVGVYLSTDNGATWNAAVRGSGATAGQNFVASLNTSNPRMRTLENVTAVAAGTLLRVEVATSADLAPGGSLDIRAGVSLLRGVT